MEANNLHGSPRFKAINRKQLLLRPIDVDQLISEDHPARNIWEIVGRLDLQAFYVSIGSVEGSAGRSAFDPRLLICLWIYAYSRGIGSAREISRLCQTDPALQWLTGMDSINHHTLSDFRIGNKEALDSLFTQVLGLLSLEGLITLERVMQDGTKIRADAGGKSFCREARVRKHLEVARRQVEAMGDPRQERSRERCRKAQETAAHERVKKLEKALREIEQLRVSKMEDRKGYEPRVSITDPDARMMKNSDGGYAPSYNVQVTTDAKAGLIADVRVTKDSNDKHQLLPAMTSVETRLGRRPKQALADGDFTTNLSVVQMAERGIDFIGSWTQRPAPKVRAGPDWRGIYPEFQRQAFHYDAEQDQYICPAGKPLTIRKTNHLPHGGKDLFYRAEWSDCRACPHRQQCCPRNRSHGRVLTRRVEPAPVTSFKAKMQTPEAKTIYRQRSPVAEFPIAWIKAKMRLWRFHVRGAAKVAMEALWACLTFNLQRLIRLRPALAAA